MKRPIGDPPACEQNLMAMRDTLDILGGKWRLLILHYLITREQTTNTFNKIQNDITGISPKVLSKELKVLEIYQLVSREVLNTKPITVNYAITEYGKSTEDLIQTLVSWGVEYRNKVLQK